MPNLGYTQIGSNNAAINNWKLVQRYAVTPASNGTATRIWVYTPASTPATNRCKLGVYDGYTAGSNLVASGELVNATPGQWNYVTINIPVTAGVSLHAAQAQNGTHGIQFSPSSGNNWQNIGTNEGYDLELGATLESGTPSGDLLSLYIEYEESGGSNSPSSSASSSPSSSASSSPSSSPSGSLSHSPSASASSSPSAGNSPSSSPSSSPSTSSSPSSSPSAGSTYGKILCIGDSITEQGATGIQYSQSYRLTLQDYLTIGLYDFVGVYNSTMPAPYDNAHSGASGHTIAMIATRLTSELTNNMQNCGLHAAVLLLAGTNNVNNDTNTANYQGYVDAIEDMIDEIHTFNSSIRILVGNILPVIDSATDTRATYFNMLLTAMLTTKRQTITNLYRVDHNAVFKANSNWATQYMTDNLHPNITGLRLMAFEWYKALMGVEFTRFTISTNMRSDIVEACRIRLNYGTANSYPLLRLFSSTGTLLSNHNLTLFTEVNTDIIQSTASADANPVNSGTPYSFQILNRDRELEYSGLVEGSISTSGAIVAGSTYNIVGSVFLTVPQVA